jgi:hypothetical protein
MIEILKTIIQTPRSTSGLVAEKMLEKKMKENYGR